MRLHSVLVRSMIAAGLGGCAVAQTQVDLRTQSKSVDFSAASSTRTVRTGTALPSTCSVAESFFLTNAIAGSNLYFCTSANVWTAEGGGSGSGVPNYSQAFTTQTSVVLAHNLGTLNVIVACYDASNVEFAYSALTVTSLNSVTVTFFMAQTGRCVVNGFGAPATNRYATSFTTQTAVVVSAAAHNLGTGDLAVTCYDAASPKTKIEPDRVQIDATNNVTITFFTAQSGRCIVQ